ncbi:hypothetical protein KE639_06618 [Streptomyces sp. V17-9]|nr:hypothetical protein KE639_06618 [Streptomyces sp. V17-9]
MPPSHRPAWRTPCERLTRPARSAVAPAADLAVSGRPRNPRRDRPLPGLHPRSGGRLPSLCPRRTVTARHRRRGRVAQPRWHPSSNGLRVRCRSGSCAGTTPPTSSARRSLHASDHTPPNARAACTGKDDEAPEQEGAVGHVHPSHLVDLALGHAGSDADVGALRHAESCPRCREELLRLTRVVTTARSVEASDLPVAPPECVWQRISLEVLQETAGLPRPGKHPAHRSAGGKASVVRHRWTNRADGSLLGRALTTAVLLLRRRRIKAGRATDR